MVEKWLLQVQLSMLQSMKEIINESVVSYENTQRTTWLLSWPGQVCFISVLVQL